MISEYELRVAACDRAGHLKTEVWRIRIGYALYTRILCLFCGRTEPFAGAGPILA